MSDETVYVDDLTVLDGDELWRKIPPGASWVSYDPFLGRLRPSTKAFQNLEGELMSVLIAKIVQEDGRTADDIISRFPGYSLASITAGSAREANQKICPDPYPPDDPKEAAHAHLVGKKSKTVKRMLSKSAKWIIEPQPTDQ